VLARPGRLYDGGLAGAEVARLARWSQMARAAGGPWHAAGPGPAARWLPVCRAGRVRPACMWMDTW